MGRLPCPAAKPLVFERKWRDLLQKKKRYTRSKFQNEVMARSYDSGTKPVSFEEVRRCCLPDKHLIEPEQITRQMKATHTYAGVDWGCHDDQTEVLTEGGWKLFRDVSSDEKVAQFSKDTKEMSFAVPSRLTVKDYEGELLHYTGRGVDMMLTPNHRMLARRAKGPWRTLRADEVAKRASSQYFRGDIEWEGEEVPTFTLPGLPVSRGYQGCAERTFKMDDWLELLGYFISEGGLCWRGERPSCVKMSQRVPVNQETADLMLACMRRMGIAYSEFPNEKTGDLNWTLCGKQLWHWWWENIGARGHLKRIPREFLRCSRRQLQILWDALVRGDGTLDSREGNANGSYSSTSEGLIRDVQELGVRLAYKTTSSLQRVAEGNRRAQYRCSFSKGRDLCFADATRKGVERVAYSGKVYCCTVPEEYIITRRNGCVAFQGNTGDESFTIISIWHYDVGGRFSLLFAKRYAGVEADPDHTIQDMIKWFRKFNVNRIGADWGFGFHANPQLMKAFGANKVLCYQHAGSQKEKVKWDKMGMRFVTHRTRVLGDVFTLIKKGPVSGGMAFPHWDEFETYANDILAVYQENNEKRGELVYDHPRGVPDDFLHTVCYALLASQFEHPRPDLHSPSPGQRPFRG